MVEEEAQNKTVNPQEMFNKMAVPNTFEKSQSRVLLTFFNPATFLPWFFWKFYKPLDDYFLYTKVKTKQNKTCEKCNW